MAAPAEELRYPYLEILDIFTFEHCKFYNKAIVWIPESDRYDITISKWTEFYQELEDAVSTFVFKSAVFVVTSRYGGHVPTEVKDVIMLYPSITKVMV